MRFRTVAIAAVILVLASVGALAAFTVADDARGEAAQTTIDRTDQLAVEQNITQHLESDDDHDPTAYGDTIDVEVNGSQWEAGEDYEYDADAGSIEFLRDSDDPANVSYSYHIPADQAADDRLQTLTVSTGLMLRAFLGVALIVVLLFLGGFMARRLNSNGSQRGR